MAVGNTINKINFDFSFNDLFFILVTDTNTATGASPERIADDIRQAILSEEKDVILAPLLPIAVQWLRLLCPSIYFWVMEKRARRMNANN